MTRTSARQTRTALMILTSFALALALFAGTGVAHAQEVFTCDKWASSSGNDANDGSKARPVLTVNVLASKLQPGQTGCLVAGETVHMGAGGTGIVSQSGLAGSPITIRSAPEGRAALTGHMRIDGNNVVVRDIDFRGLGERGDLYPKSNHIHVVGDNVSILDNDITSPKGICVSVGTIASYLPQDDPNQTANSARNFVLDGNRIHGCGLQTTLVSTDSGMHGVYLAYTEDARITNNFIYDNRVRGLQLYSRAERTLVEHNVIDGNSGNLNIGGSSHEGGYFVSRDTTVRNNIISNSTFAWPKDQYQVVGNYKTTATATEYNNLVTGNCVYHQDASKNFGGYGIAQSNNLSLNPMYVNRAGKNFALQNGSPCAGKGPQTTGGDTTPPTSNVYPSNGSTDVVTDMVAATFSEEMMASSINTNTFTLKKTSDNSAVNGTASYTSVGHEGRFTAAASLAADTQYTATLNGVKDLAGNTHALKSWSFRTTPDDDVNLAPTITDLLPANGSSTTETRPRLSATVEDDAPLSKANIQLRVDGTLIGNDHYAYSPDTGSLWRVFEPEDASFSYGTHEIEITVTDAQGKMVSKTSTFEVVNPNVDTIAPVGTITVKGGAEYSNTLAVNLTLSATDNAGGTGVKEMRLKNGTDAWRAWEPYTATKAWTLKSVQGTPQNVHAQFRDGDGNMSSVATDSITFDTVRPKVLASPSTLPSSTTRASIYTSAVAYFPAIEKIPVENLNQNTFFLRVNGTTTKLAATYRYDETQSQDRAILTPAKPLLRDKIYQVVMTTAIKDAAGNALDQDPNTAGLQGKTWKFTTQR